MSRASGFASVFALGVVLMLAASPAAAAIYNCDNPNVCNCNVDCDTVCGNVGPPEPEPIYCGEVGVCVGGSQCQGCLAVNCSSTINGTSGGDTLSGSSDHECINGLAGNDTISGNAGDDTIHGGDGNDTMYGGSGNDCLYGDGGSDNCNGDTGTDYCEGETEVTCEN